MASIATAGGTVSGSAKEIIVTAATGVAVVVVLYWLAKREVSNAAGAVADAVASVAKPVIQAVNPASDKNLIYQGSNWMLNTFTPYENATVGTAYADAAEAAGKYLNPASKDNIVQQAGNAIVRGVTGNEGDTLSMKIGDGIDWLKSVF